MKLFVIGATGRTGWESVQQSLARGHDVTAFVRSAESITLHSERLTVLKGDAMDENQLFDAMQNHDAVVSALGPREVFKPSSLLYDSALATTRAMNRSGVKRLIVLSAAAHFPGIPNRIVSLILRNHMRDSRAMEQVAQASGLDWTIARPPRLTEQDYTTYRSREDAAPKMGFSLSRKAVAAFMLDAIEQKKHFHKIVGIAKRILEDAMFTAYIVVTLLAAAANVFSATLDFIRFKPILINMARVGVSESWITTLGTLKAAGALGLLVGFRVPLIGI